jgi:hypothetical protein
MHQFVRHQQIDESCFAGEFVACARGKSRPRLGAKMRRSGELRSRPKSEGENYNPTAPAAEQAAKKLKQLSFRGTIYAEESLILLTLNHGEIPRFARDDTKIGLFPQPLKPHRFGEF